MKRYFHDIVIAFESILSNKLKSILTALGIIFGVAAVISMLAIGKGAQQEILEQIKMVGVNNILINPIVEEEASENGDNGDQSSGEKQQSKFSRGLSILDVQAIRNQIPSVERISPEIGLNSFAMQSGKRFPAKLVGVTNDYFELYNLSLTGGAFFNDYQEEHGIQVCVIGANIDAKFFPKTNPINQYVKFGAVWLKVIGVLEKTEVTLTGFEETGVNVYNDNIYIPVKAMLMRFQNRALVNTKLNVGANVRMHGMGFIAVRSSKEIGTRMAIGAKKKDIVVQFLSEAILISVTGGFIGVVLGIVLSNLIHHISGILTIVSPFSVIIAFGVSAAVGVVFGHSPAKRASEKDPIESLRYE